jgi:hypothetical protein
LLCSGCLSRGCGFVFGSAVAEVSVCDLFPPNQNSHAGRLGTTRFVNRDCSFTVDHGGVGEVELLAIWLAIWVARCVTLKR